MSLLCLSETFRFGNMHLYFEDSKIHSYVWRLSPMQREKSLQNKARGRDVNGYVKVLALLSID